MADFVANAGAMERAEAAIKANPANAQVANFSNIEVRDMSSTGFSKGDRFQIDCSKKYKRVVRGNDAYLLLVTMSDGSVKELFLGQMSRSVVAYKKTNDPTAMPERDTQATGTRADGSATEIWMRFGNAEEAANALNHQFIVVSDVRSIHTFNRSTNSYRDQSVYKFDLCDENGKVIAASAWEQK